MTELFTELNIDQIMMFVLIGFVIIGGLSAFKLNKLYERRNN